MLASFAAAVARAVLLHPGGPYIKTPADKSFALFV